MERLRPAWLLALPLAVLAWLGAHRLAYDIAFSGADARQHALAASGHGYLDHAPLLAALCTTLAALGFVTRVFGEDRARGSLPAWAFGALPLLGFAVQEHLERALHGGGLPWDTSLQPVFLLGLALQLPFGLAAGLVARALLTTADEVGTALEAKPRVRLRPTVALFPVDAADLTPVPALASGRAGRAPPVRL